MNRRCWHLRRLPPLRPLLPRNACLKPYRVAQEF
jgi:hypothetical protein